MNKNIKFRMFLLSLIFLVGQSSAADVIVTPSTKTVTQGQTFDLNISIDPKGTAIAGAQLNIGFNKSVININNIIEGNFFEQNGENTFFNNGTINNSLGTVENIFCVILGPFNVSTPEIFITINVTAVGSSGQSGINLSNVKISDPYSNYVGLNTINESIMINETAPDITLTNSVSNLRQKSKTPKFISWKWTDPKTPDFAKVMVYINGKFKTNVTKGISYYKEKDLTPNIPYTISTHTVDTSGNINLTWVNSTIITSRK